MLTIELMEAYKAKAGESLPTFGLTEAQHDRALREARKYVKGSRSELITYEELVGSIEERIY